MEGWKIGRGEEGEGWERDFPPTVGTDLLRFVDGYRRLTTCFITASDD